MHAVTEFISGDGLKEAVSTIVGDIHMDAAKFALETTRDFLNPKDRINSVITHLEVAALSCLDGAR